MYFLFYKTTNLINGKFYIGSHQTLKLDDGYLGGGRILKKALKKYGRENFKREIIANCVSAQLAREIEAVLVRYSIDNFKRDCYNRSYSGTGAMLGKDNAFYGKSHTDETKKYLSERASEAYKGEGNPFYGKQHTEEFKKKLSEERKGVNRSNNETISRRAWRQSKGWWCTPTGCYTSDREAAKFTGVGRNCIRSWCKNPDKVAGNNYQIPEEYWGKTWRENGFWFKEK